jgi:hypothetical protein
MNKTKNFLAIGLILLLICTVSAVANWIYSPNTITVTVSEYSLSELTVDNANPIKNQIIRFSGTLYLGGNLVGSGFNVSLFKNDVIVASNLTDSNGSFIIKYNVSEVGTFSFKVGYRVS